MNAPAPAAAITAAAEMFDRIPLAAIVASKTNPRKTFDQVKLDELAASIKDHGVIQPVLVRVLDNGNGMYELVAGERRFRASKLAGLEVIPATIRSLTDEQALQIQVIENLQRDDLHPLEEADGYGALIDQHGYSAKDLAAKIGKSKEYIYGRLKLRELGPAGRQFYLDGKLNASVALLLARIPVPDLQRKAAGELANGPAGEPMSVRLAESHLLQHYMLRLTEAPFDVAAVHFYPKKPAKNAAGDAIPLPPCAECPKRTGNQPELFGDVGDADVCTDPKCFDHKRSQHIEDLRIKAMNDGKEFFVGKAARAIHPQRWSQMEGWKPLDTYCPGSAGRTFEELKTSKTVTAFMEDPHNPGRVVEIISDAEIVKLVASKGFDKVKPNTQSGGYDHEKEEAKRALEFACRKATFLAVRQKNKGALPAELLRQLVVDDLEDIDDPEFFAGLWSPVPLTTDEEIEAYMHQVFERLTELSAKDLMGMFFDLRLGGMIRWHRCELLDTLADVCKVDVKAIRKKVQADLKAAAKAAAQ